MGCGGSKPAPAAAPAAAPVEAQVVQTVAPSAGDKGQGKGKGKGKGKGGGTKWQIWLEGRFQDYGPEEDAILKRAYMTGSKNAKFHLRGQNYEYNFKKMIQKNKDTKKERQIRPPLKGPKPPKKPLLPTGPMTIITVRAGQPGTVISVPDKNNPGQNVQVFVPKHAKPGSKLLVPLPNKGETVEAVQKKQEEHDKEQGTKTGWSTGGAVAATGAAGVGIAAVGVGGVILGDHLAGGEMAATIGAAAVDASEWATDAADPALDAAGDWATGAAADVGDWAAGAGDDVADWAGDAGIIDFAGDAADWLGGAADDAGDFIMDLF